jgi:CheY-like chemotaxis protein
MHRVARRLPSTATRTVLLVQHDDDNREMYAEFLQHKGYTPRCVSTGTEALRVAADADIIVTGILLGSDMDGLELIQELRNDERTRTRPVIVLTACAWQSERERAERAGCDAFLPKPCAPDELVREIARVLAVTKLRAVRRRSASARPKRRRTKLSA